MSVTEEVYYQSGFDDGKIAEKDKVLEIIDKYLYSPFNIKEQTLYEIKKEIEKT